MINYIFKKIDSLKLVVIKNKMRKLFLFVMTVRIFQQLSFAQTFDPVLAAKLQTKLDSMKTAYNIKGISACVIYPGEGLWKGVTGVSYDSVPINSEMVFGIASNTKLFTAVTLLKLSENNIIHIDDSLHKWLHNFNNVDSNITIRQLLNHTSGIANYTDVTGYLDSIYLNPNRIFLPTELMTWVGAATFPAGTGWNYSNTNYLLAGMIAESATGKNIAQLIRSYILNPLQLDSTFFSVQEHVSGTIAHPWAWGRDINGTPRTSLNSAAYSAGAIYSTSGEMAQWYQKLMSGQVLNSNSFNQMTTFVGWGEYGLGLIKIVLGNRTCFGHDGSIRGYQSCMVYDTTSHAVISVLINATPFPSPVRLVAEQLILALNSFPMALTDLPDQINNIVIFPNPSNDKVKLNIANQKINKISIYNVTGYLVQEYFTTEFSIEDLPSGLYFVILQTDKGNLINKLIKQ